MARKESVALGGYFPCPEHQVANIAKLIKHYDEDKRESHKASFLDPCAGDGAAIHGLMEGIGFPRPDLYTCEMEAQRAKALKERTASFFERSKRTIHGDAFRVSFRHGYSNGVSLLWLNPPYDTDKVYGRLEQKFLDRFTGTLVDGGVLLFLVPYYALAASAETLGREYADLHCFRFPEADFQYKQVVLCARKVSPLHNPNQAIVAQVEAWAKDVESIPGFPNEPVHELPDNLSGGLTEWTRRPVDVTTLQAKVQPWVQTTRGGARIPVLGVIPELPVQDMLLRTFPVATPPRPAHIAAGIASGLFNGSRIEPDHASSGLPSLLVKGIFDREFRTVEEKRNKDGEVVGVYRVQQPKLVTTILDLSTHQYHILKTQGSGSLDVSEMTVADLLQHYGASLMTAMEKQCPVLYDPRTDSDTITLAQSPRQPFTAQAHTAKALVKLLGGPSVPMKARKGKAAILLGEIGSGKSTVALLTVVTCGATRPLVLCPPHLLDSWTHEIEVVLPDAEIRVLTDIAEVDEVAAIQGDQVVVSILSRETAKLDHGWEGAGPRCPKCGSVTPLEDQAKKRSRCKHRPLLPQDREARLCLDLAHKLSPVMPDHSVVKDLLTTRMGLKRLKHYSAMWAINNANNASNIHERSFVKLYGGLTRRPTQWERMLDDGPYTNPDFAWVDTLIADLVAGVQGTNQWTINREISGTLLILLLTLNDNQRTAAVVKELLTAGNTFGVTVSHMLADKAHILEECEDTRRQWDPYYKLPEELERIADGGSFSSIKMAWSNGILGLSLPGGLACSAGSIMAAGELLTALAGLATFEYTHETCGEFLYQGVAKPRRNALARYIQKRTPDAFDFLVLDECFVAGTQVSGLAIEDIQVGDFVDSFDEVERRVVKKRVTRLWRHPPSSLVRLRFSNGSTFVCTPNHPILTNQGWIPAGLCEDLIVFEHEYANKNELSQNTKVEVLGSKEDQDLRGVRVDSVEILEPGSDGRFGGVCPDGQVYNLEVEDTHTYFAEGILVHNCHEYATETSAQSRSAHRLTGLKLPTLLMTGSIMNGYAGSLFINMWSMSHSFREEFDRSEKQRFIDRYGYRKMFVQQKDDDGEIIEYGSQSDRVTTTEKAAGFAPGILPLFLLRHLLRISVTLHKADLALDLPKCTQRMHLIAPDQEQEKNYKMLQTGLLNKIKADMFDSCLSGKLFGQLAELPSYLDRAVVGNTVERTEFEIRYPESVGGELVVEAPTFPDDVLLPKEEWMLDTIEQELSEGRNCMVFCWHRSLLNRLAELIEQRIGEDVAVLHAEKVSTKKRQAWITKQVVNKGVRVMVANPVTIQTGLNNLVHFNTEIWMESPACNPIVYRQAVGRVDRIGAKKETRIHFPVYSGTLQEQLYDLLMRKVAVSVSTDGLDPESALQAAGVGADDYLAGLSIGKQLWAMLQGELESEQTLLEALTPGNRAALRDMTDPD